MSCHLTYKGCDISLVGWNMLEINSIWVDRQALRAEALKSQYTKPKLKVASLQLNDLQSKYPS